ncbi:MAG: C10 family peptidase, partial [Bacteroidales bacterium]|nr:C10 family peptidase [Bacteroidales bacterium]
MRYRYSLILLVLIVGFAQAARVPVETARQVARSLILERSESSMNMPEHREITSSVTRNAEDGEAWHLFKLSPTGFVLVAGEDQVYPVLAYSFETDFPTDAIPAHIAEWLDGYSGQISLVRQRSVEASDEVQFAWQHYLEWSAPATEDEVRGVEPLLLCNWNQSTYYNGMCPPDPDGPGGRALAGCVATAMGQVMYYYRHPQVGAGSSTYFHPDYGQLSANHGTTTYRWEEMLNSIQAPNSAIAELLYHCGIAVEMGYSPTGSGAYSSDAAAALRDHFGYSNAITLAHKSAMSDQAWKDLLKNQLDLGRPMYYHGYGSGGHAFNVDGYQGDDHFHFNWGWGGSYNGYYYVSDLNPGGSNFTNGQGAIINIEPSPASAYPPYCGNLKTLTAPVGTFEDGSGPLSDYESNAGCSWLISPQQYPGDSISTISLQFDRFDVQSNQDYVAVYAGSSAAGTLIGKYSGTSLPPKVSVEGNVMYIEFVTDSDTQASGFYATYTSTVPDYCSKSPAALTDSVGTLSDGSATKNYNNRSICQWAIQPEGAEAVVLAFTAFDTEPQHDFLEVYAYEPLTGNGTLLGRFSGNSLPPVLTSNTGAFYLIFFSNAEETRGGWEAHYSASAVGIEEKVIAEARIFPNPALDILNVAWIANNPGILRLELLDLTGRTIYSGQAS